MGKIYCPSQRLNSNLCTLLYIFLDIHRGCIVQHLIWGTPSQRLQRPIGHSAPHPYFGRSPTRRPKSQTTLNFDCVVDKHPTPSPPKKFRNFFGPFRQTTQHMPPVVYHRIEGGNQAKILSKSLDILRLFSNFIFSRNILQNNLVSDTCSDN